MKELTGNQKVALDILGYVPAGYVLVAEIANVPLYYGVFRRIGAIYADGKKICSILL